MEIKPNNDDLNEENKYDIFVSKRFMTYSHLVQKY